jgi:hypothetical protein
MCSALQGHSTKGMRMQAGRHACLLSGILYVIDTIVPIPYVEILVLHVVTLVPEFWCSSLFHVYLIYSLLSDR